MTQRMRFKREIIIALKNMKVIRKEKFCESKKVTIHLKGGKWL